MPDFSVDSWTSFKEQFMSVIRFILYCFDLFFDSVRSRPLLYAMFFFPIFAAALLVLLSVVQRLSMVPESSDVGYHNRGFGLLRIHGSKSDNKAIARNLAVTNHKLDSIDHKIGKVSAGMGKGSSAGMGKGAAVGSGKGASAGMGKGSSAGMGKGAAVGSGKGASAGMGKGSSANNIGSADTGLSVSRGFSSIKSLIKKRKSDKIARKEQDAFIYDQIEKEQRKYEQQYLDDWKTTVIRSHTIDDLGRNVTNIETQKDGVPVSFKRIIDEDLEDIDDIF